MVSFFIKLFAFIVVLFRSLVSVKPSDFRLSWRPDQDDCRPCLKSGWTGELNRDTSMHTTSSSPKRFASLLVAFTVLLNAATAYLSADSYEASDLAEARGDDSGGSETERQGAPTVADERKLTDGSTCPATCFGDSCDY